ncbi:metal-dependent hydrolase [Thermococcus sp.]|uniref:metal-dependent hydrolase n=1 Tax=Thermococcus sp. TaxID=35749 RepID=UPI0025EAA90E|nr:metal-dependent hydrolase [Thermococcus sp.]
MPNYDVHVLSGIVTYPLTVLLAALIKTYIGVPLELTTTATVLGYGFYILGADLPDMDHPNALIHRGTKPIVAVLAGGATYVNILPGINVGAQWVNVTVAWTISALIGVGAWVGFTAVMPKHRGIIHSLLFAGIYGVVAFATGSYGLGMSHGESLFLGLAAFLGYTLHLVLDGSLKLV